MTTDAAHRAADALFDLVGEISLALKPEEADSTAEGRLHFARQVGAANGFYLRLVNVALPAGDVRAMEAAESRMRALLDALRTDSDVDVATFLGDPAL